MTNRVPAHLSLLFKFICQASSKQKDAELMFSKLSKVRTAKTVLLVLSPLIVLAIAFTIWDRLEYNLPRSVAGAVIYRPANPKEYIYFGLNKASDYLLKQKDRRIVRKQWKIAIQRFLFDDLYGTFIAHDKGRLYLHFRPDSKLEWRLYPDLASSFTGSDFSDVFTGDLTWQKNDEEYLMIVGPQRTFVFKMVIPETLGGREEPLTHAKFYFAEEDGAKRQFNIGFENQTWNRKWLKASKDRREAIPPTKTGRALDFSDCRTQNAPRQRITGTCLRILD